MSGTDPLQTFDPTLRLSVVTGSRIDVGDDGVNDAATLLGACIDHVGFGVAHFRLDLSDETRRFSLSTSADVSVDGDGDTDFRETKAISPLIDLLGASLKGIRIDQDCRSAALAFDNGINVRVWWPDKIYDNLLIVRDERDDGWFVLG